MKHYIVDYEIWVSNKAIGWGNCDIATNGPDNAELLLGEIIKHCTERSGLEGAKIRVTGLFKL